MWHYCSVHKGGAQPRETSGDLVEIDSRGEGVESPMQSSILVQTAVDQLCSHLLLAALEAVVSHLAVSHLTS